MIVLSLFDGMSCAQIALKELGIPVEKYYASEIDKFAIKQTQLNFPETIQLGDVNNWQLWDIHWSDIDLVCAGSPCQGFSFAGKQLAFDDPRSKLFFVFAEILENCRLFNPDVKFLLENVDMKKEYLRIISEYVGIFPEKINSALVSAQNRERWYWTDIRTKRIGMFDEIYSDIPQPKDRGILLKDILQPENEVDEKYYLSEKAINGMLKHKHKHKEMGHGFGFLPRDGDDKSPSILSRYYKDGKECLIKLDRDLNPKSNQDKASTLSIGGHGNGDHSDMDILLVASRGRGENWEQQLEARDDGKTNTLTGVQKDNMVMYKPSIQHNVANKILNENQQNKFNANVDTDKHNTVTCAIGRMGSSSEYMDSVSKISVISNSLRRLTPIECSRLQTIPSWYKWECSDSQIYRMLGNGWTVEVIKHIFSLFGNKS